MSDDGPLDDLEAELDDTTIISVIRRPCATSHTGYSLEVDYGDTEYHEVLGILCSALAFLTSWMNGSTTTETEPADDEDDED